MMPSRTTYTYVVLRYVHDIAAAEFVNVGVVMMTPQGRYVGAKFKTTYGRIKKAFPTLDGESFRRQMRQLQATFDRIAQGDIAKPSSIEESNASTLLQLVHSVLRPDDSSLQWSPVGSGLSSSPEDTLNRLFQRFVTKYDDDAVISQRKDDDVWKCFRTELEKRNVLSRLEEKVIAVEDDSIKFSHAWKNGAWHCYEPISFDLASDSSIKEKAHRWLGQVSSVKEAPEQFLVFFLVGKPSDASLQGAYAQAISILRKTPKSEIVEEADAAAFSDQVATEIERHESRSF